MNVTIEENIDILIILFLDLKNSSIAAVSAGKNTINVKK
jgi:hypothetical protein|tara:strand:+ start:2577 stop:2693 length:117 start_codon:yes stop_codon:yes gene_type:complete